MTSKTPDGLIDPTGPLQSPVLATGDSYSYIFDSPGTCEYRCSPHSFMVGVVAVGDGGGTGGGTGDPGGGTGDPGDGGF